jgi:tRNA dimethylallyltransferase
LNTSPPTPLVIVGCTASGKSDLGEALAQHLNAPIMAVDSMQVYRGMDIGTAKPDAVTRARIPHLMIDVADPWEAYSAARFVNQARPHLAASPPPILIAGTFLYLRALIEGLFEGPSADESLRAEFHERAAKEGAVQLHKELAAIDPPAAHRIHPNDLRRIIRALEVHRITGTPISTLQTQWNAAHPAIDATYIGIRWEKEALSRRINARVKRMMQAGLLDEVDRLRQRERGLSEEAASAVGYRQLLDHLDGKCPLDDAVEQIKIQTRYLAKMQRTWLKKWPAPPLVKWLDAADGVSPEELVQQALQIVHTP